MLMNCQRRWPLIVLCVVLATMFVIALAFAQAYRARVEAGRYVGVITQMRIGTTYDLAVKQLHDANIPVDLPGDCHHECLLELVFVNKWQYKLHLAPLMALAGDLRFKDDKLVRKTTLLGGSNPYFAGVRESTSTVSAVRVHQYNISVDLSPSDFTEYRRLAYSFNLKCLGSMRQCTTDEFLPTVNELERITSRD
ncbi:MAG: hypothetical protein ABSA80_10105 [Terriglobales bacterium]|jgi:hypothetical protein